MSIPKIVAVTLLIAFSSYSGISQQEDKTTYVFGQMGIEGGNYAGLSFALNFITKKEFSFQFGYQLTNKVAEAKPSDFQLGGLDFFALGLTAPYDTYHTFQASAGKVITLRNHPKTRFNLLGGVGYTFYEYATDFERTGNSFGLIASYTFDTENDSTVFFLIQPKVEFCLSERNGISLGPVVKISERETFFGINVSYIFGRLRSEID